MKKLFVIKDNDDLKRSFPVLKELRPHLNLSDFLFLYEQSHKNDGYEIVAIEEDGEIIAVMGYRFLFDLVRGKHVYIDDLISTELARSKGLGAELLQYAENVAKESNTRSLRLCTGLDNERGMKLYENNGWVQKALAYTKNLEE